MEKNDFGKAVKKRLIDLGMTQNDLIDLVKEKTDLFLDTGYLSKIYSGERSPSKIIEAICTILDSDNPYKEAMR